MVAAALEVLETGALTPLIKEELKYTIQSRRLAAGKQELTVDLTPTTPRRHRQMTKEEENRAYKRRTQNREAAQRFRQRQKDEVDRLMKKSMRLESANTTLRAEVRRLNVEKEQLLGTLQSHLRVCPMGMLTR
ncbi:cyclic AMP-dependent transcription factor ATF-3-like [Pomacea canaliculata]|uniref:cyclic AMP-dependent transcription factor ATF-3-like n=1 Tax=Pomacea canaliculata TaxID=400727 RepID=UPI000D735BE8|nr:cyclic AMP-dependent transcription factor ATF-3-like [Pomacea canaliculata]